jgi:hypothetical protein
MKSIADFSTVYILVFILTLIVFIRAVIDFLVEYKYPNTFNVKKVDESLVSNLVFLKHSLDVPYGLIVLYLIFNVKLNSFIYLVIVFSVMSIVSDYLFDHKNIYYFIDKKNLNQQIVKFIDEYRKIYLDLITFLVSLYVLYKVL